MVGLLELPVDVLLGIFKLLDLPTLALLSSTCSYLRFLVNEECLTFASQRLLVTNQSSQQIRKRSLALLSPLGKFCLNQRWRRNRFRELKYLHSREKYRPWISVQARSVLVAQGRNVYRHGRTEGGITRQPLMAYSAHDDDVNRLVVRDNNMITCGNEGRIIFWDVGTGQKLFSHSQPALWNECLLIDWARQTLVLAHNTAAKLQFFTVETYKFILEKEMEDVGERVWSVALSEDGDLCAVGTTGYSNCPLCVIDVQTGKNVMEFQDNWKRGAGVFAALWETPQLLLTGSYDTCVRLWDTRSGRAVRQWPDPHDDAVFSLATDHSCTVMAGTARYGRVTLWDVRHTNCIRVYSTTSSGSSPVYSLDFDPCHLFVALESSLHILNFAYSKSTRLPLVAT